MTLHCMLDIETLGTGNDALILSIGAVKFEPNPNIALGLDALGDRFYVAIDPASAMQAGGKIDAATVLWWLDPERSAARDALFKDDRVDIVSALEGFSMWFGPESTPIWGNGATFDNVIVRRAFERLGMDCPWKFWHDRCHRTIKSLNHHVKLAREGTHHNALDDAIYQAHHLSLIAHEKDIILA